MGINGSGPKIAGAGCGTTSLGATTMLARGTEALNPKARTTGLRKNGGGTFYFAPFKYYSCQFYAKLRNNH